MFKNRPVTAFFLLLLFFIVPFIVAQYLYKHHVNVFNKTTNHGVLMQPLLDIHHLPLQTLEGEKFDVNTWQKHWTLLYISGHPYNEHTEKMIYYLRQIRTAMGKNQDKVLRAYVSAEDSSRPSAKDLSEIQKHYVGTDLLQTRHADLVKFLNEEGLSNVTLEQGVVYIVDPQGYVMMRYPVVVNPEAIFKDLDHLLRINN